MYIEEWPCVAVALCVGACINIPGCGEIGLIKPIWVGGVEGGPRGVRAGHM